MKSPQKLALLLLPAIVSAVIPKPNLSEYRVTLPRQDDFHVLHYRGTNGGQIVQNGVKLRILGIGDSITVGFGSWADGNGYRKKLKENLSKNKVVFAGTEEGGDMDDGYFAAWSGQTINSITGKVEASLEQRPNVVLLAAGTNDMNRDPLISKEGNEVDWATGRLWWLITKILEECPDATVLVAMIINTCENPDFHSQRARTQRYRQAIADLVLDLRLEGEQVLAADFSTFPDDQLQDCVHPTNTGYDLMGDYWYDFLLQVPDDWIETPIGPDPNRNQEGVDENGGLDKDIPPPDWGTLPLRDKAASEVMGVAKWAKNDPLQHKCNGKPLWREAGKIALGIGSNGDWKYKKNWIQADHSTWGGNGKVADGIGKDSSYVRLVDMDGDGKADYVWVDPKSGEITCWLNKIPNDWVPAGSKGGVIGTGVKGSKFIYLADMNGDGMADYLVVNPSDGSVRVWWNWGHDDSMELGWRFEDGGVIATGVPHANLVTLRFPDINGDGRADYVYIGEGGSLRAYVNVGGKGGKDVLFHAQGGIATGATNDISRLVFADINGDGRDDYLIWDGDGGLTGFLNQRTNREGVPLYINQGPPKTIADGISKNPQSIRLADMDGDGKDDYAYIDEKGAVFLWYNRGETDDTMAIDGLRFADVDGDGADDYIWIDPKSGAPTVYLNKGPNENDAHGWLWEPLNDGKPIASGAAPGAQVKWGDVDGDKLSDYLDVDPKSGLLKVYRNAGESDSEYGWHFDTLGVTASGLGPGRNVRFADIDGDGLDDYIYLKENGGTIIYRSVFKHSPNKWEPLTSADASGIGQRPEEIQLIDINGDGKADYVWTRPYDGSVRVWLNDYPNQPTWREIGTVAEGVGTSGSNIRYANLQHGGRPDYVVVDPKTGALGAWLNGCDENDLAPELLIEDKPPVCHKESDFPGHVPIHEDWVSWSQDACKDAGKYSHEIRPDDEPCDQACQISWRVNPGFKFETIKKDSYDQKVRFSVTWLDGCTVDGPRKDMDIDVPTEEYSVRCWQAFTRPWEYCWDQNNGVGDYQDIRCLRYQVDAGV